MDKTKLCIACFEPIHFKATQCRFCNTSQKPNRWHIVSNTFKWIGGIITVISLVGGMLTLSRHYQDWQEKRDTLADLVGAAEWLMKTQDYTQAWDIYKEALELDPVSTEVRRGQYRLAKLWLRNFRAKSEQADLLLNDISKTLYRGIRTGASTEIASTLAHAGWVQVLRSEFRLPVTLDIDLLFQQALAENPNDLYANAMNAYWLLLKPGISVEKLQRAESKFYKALEVNNDRTFIRNLQFSSLRAYSFGQADEIEQETLRILLRISYSMMKNGETKPSKNRRIDILKTYGSAGRGNHIESSLSALPPTEHLALLDWLMEGISYSIEPGTGRDMYQFQYLKARLTEEQGNTDDALQQYRALLSATNSAKELNKLIDRGIERLSGEFPSRTLVRTYLNDPMNTSDPWQFHLQTLLYFDPKWQSENLTQALNFFETQLDQSNPQLTVLLDTLSETSERIRKIISTGDDIARSSPYTSGLSANAHKNARINLLNIGILHEQILLSVDRYDGAVAVLNDLKQLAGTQGDRWLRDRLGIEYELARAHALRAEKTNNTEDIEKSIKYLQGIIQQGAVDGEIASWDEIKGNDFKSLRTKSSYIDMIRGR